MLQNFMKDPLANSYAIVILLALIVSWITSLAIILKDAKVDSAKSWHTKLLPIFALLGIPAVLDLLQNSGVELLFAGIAAIILLLNIIIPILRTTEKSAHPLVVNWNKWAVPFLAVAGLAVAGYLAFVEAANVTPLCGPVGDCASVQSSKYAVLFGILPIGVLGFAGYIAILIAWLVRHFGPASLNKWSDLALWGFGIFGVLFSTYLTFLEPFVIGATCMWCITSAVLMILLLWVTTPAAQQALTISHDDDEEEHE